MSRMPTTFFCVLACASFTLAGCANNPFKTKQQVVDAPPLYRDSAYPPSAGPIASTPPSSNSTLTLGDSAAPDIKPAVDPAPQPTQTNVSYTIQKGDTLWSIANRTYGDGQKWKDIVAANPGLSPSKLRVGQSITLP